MPETTAERQGLRVKRPGLGQMLDVCGKKFTREQCEGLDNCRGRSKIPGIPGESSLVTFREAKLPVL
jgi:hypothetical protein